MCFREKILIHVLDKVHSYINYSVVGHDVNANESTIYIKYYVFKQKSHRNKDLYSSIEKMLWPKVHKTLRQYSTVFAKSVFQKLYRTKLLWIVRIYYISPYKANTEYTNLSKGVCS